MTVNVVLVFHESSLETGLTGFPRFINNVLPSVMKQKKPDRVNTVTTSKLNISTTSSTSLGAAFDSGSYVAID